MKLSDQLLRKPHFVAFGQAAQGGLTSVDLVANRTASTVTITASDGSAAPIPAADAANAGMMSGADKVTLDGLTVATTRGFPSRADAAAATLGAEVTHVRTGGYAAAGDKGRALYRRAASQPAHALRFQSADGAWWELVPEGGALNLRQAGAVGDGVTDDHAAIANRRHGLFVDGADVNAGTAISVDASSSGRWGIFDSSFLGNSYLVCA